MFCKNWNFETEYGPLRLHSGTGVVERAKQTLKNKIIPNLEEKMVSTVSLNRALRVLPFTIRTGLEVSPFELHHGRKPTTELTNIIGGRKSYLSDRTTLNVSVPPKRIPISMVRNEKGKVTGVSIRARKRKTPCWASHWSPKRRPVKPVSKSFQHPYTFFEKRNQKNHWKGKTRNNQEMP